LFFKIKKKKTVWNTVTNSPYIAEIPDAVLRRQGPNLK
jgi:hypothetical protein